MPLKLSNIFGVTLSLRLKEKSNKIFTLNIQNNIF